MEQNELKPQYRVASNAPSVLLAGFVQDEAKSIADALAKMEWKSTALTDVDEIERAFTEQRFDVTVIDAENLEVFAPHFIARLRSTEGHSLEAPMLAVDSSAFEGLKEQLMQAGADLVVHKPSDPKMYILNFTRAATLRLQGIGAAHV